MGLVPAKYRATYLPLGIESGEAVLIEFWANTQSVAYLYAQRTCPDGFTVREVVGSPLP